MNGYALCLGDLVPLAGTFTDPMFRRRDDVTFSRSEAMTSRAGGRWVPSNYVQAVRHMPMGSSIFEQVEASATLPKTAAATPIKLSFLGGEEVLEQIDTESSDSPAVSGFLVAHYLQAKGVAPKRIDQTEDGSTLLEFGWRGSTCVDIFPNGDVVVIIGKGEVDNIYEFNLSELPKVAGLLRNAGFGR